MCNQYESVVGANVRYDGLAAEVATIIGQRVFPGFTVPILRRKDEIRYLDTVEWAFVPAWANELPKIRPTNARAETVATSGLFRAAFTKHRCLFPCAYWVEWKGAKGSKIPHRLGRLDGEPLLLAGLWSTTRVNELPLRSAAVITTEANPRAAEVHHRMPLVLAPDDEEAWLDPATPLEHLLTLLRPADPDWLQITPDDPPPRKNVPIQHSLDF